MDTGWCQGTQAGRKDKYMYYIQQFTKEYGHYLEVKYRTCSDLISKMLFYPITAKVTQTMRYLFIMSTYNFHFSHTSHITSFIFAK